MSYDIAVIGNDEAAFEMLHLAAASKRKTLAILPETNHSAWFLGHALQRLVTNLLVDQTPQRKQMFKKTGTPRLLQSLLSRAIVKEIADQTQLLESVGVDVMLGETRFLGQRDLAVSLGVTCSREIIQARHIVIGTGIRRTAMHRPLGLMPFHRPESLFAGQRLPETVCVAGGGEFGAGLSALMSLFGVEVRHIAREDNTSTMLELALTSGVIIGYTPTDVGLPHIGSPDSDQRAIVVDCRRSAGFTDHLSLDAINVEADENGKLWCGSGFETWCGGVFGIGEVVGFSSDTALKPTLQAERIMSRITDIIPRPHLLDAFIRHAKAAKAPRSRLAVGT
jgi:NAD(P) transhydrogenase